MLVRERNVLEQSDVYSTILHAEIPDLRCFDFLSRHETECCKERQIIGGDRQTLENAAQRTGKA